ncbi:MAG TPA: ABC transporter ATP-binding protein [Polyangiaceae bacterium]|nr:ABC transporter ATP-binding protein [Polyangiaceae bacterium]
MSSEVLSGATPARLTAESGARTRPLLALESISLSFAGVRAVTEIGFEVARGEICALIGPNGAGKSSLLNVVSGVYRPEAGSIVFDGQRRSHIDPAWAARQGIARTFQNIALFKGMSVEDNILTGTTLTTRASFLEHALSLPRARRDDRRQRAEVAEVLALIGLGEHRAAPVGKLPYGLQKRVELARALAAKPRLLLLDEPFAGMSASEKQEMAELVLSVNTQLGTTILLIEHDMGLVMDLSDHVVVLDYGRKIADGAPDVVCRDAAVIDAYLGVDHGPGSVAASTRAAGSVASPSAGTAGPGAVPAANRAVA